MDANEFLKQRIKVWCHNKRQWETDKLSLLPSGDFSDEKNRLHRRENHTAFVTLEDAQAAIEMVLQDFLEENSLKLEMLKQDNFLLKKKQELLQLQSDISKDFSAYYKEKIISKLDNFMQDDVSV